MEPTPSFIDVRRVFVEYNTGNNRLRKLAGKSPARHSALRDISFQLQHGDQVTLFGKASAGKSTLLRLLTGVIKPSRGQVQVNGKDPTTNKDAAAGYISSEESEPKGDSVYDVLHAFGTTHNITNLPARIGELAELLDLTAALHRPADTLATTERLRLNIARAALSDAPLILFDDTADQLGVAALKSIITTLFPDRTVIIATRQATVAEKLKLPIILLHNATLAQQGTADEIAAAVSVPRILDVWVEGLRYDLLRELKKHSGVTSVRLMPTSDFSGQKLRITLRSSRYLPSLYDQLSQAPLIKVKELPPSLHEIIERL